MTKPRKPATIVAAARPDRDPAFASVAPPIWSSDTYRWEDADTKPAYDYSRTVSPNRDLLVEALAALEGADDRGAAVALATDEPRALG